MKLRFTFSLIIAAFVQIHAQNLLPPINSGVLPADSDPVCATPWYNNLDFDTTGYMVGDTVNDFTLFDISGSPFHLGTQLALGKPVLLVAGSLTCPYFRSKLNDINTVASAYATYISSTIVYVIEAHPTDTSPYSGTINVTTQNNNDGILFPQPTTYLGRKNLVDTLTQNYSVTCPLVIDGPCNEWWHAYGPAPLNAYLIDTNGIVIMKHGWFDQYPDNIYCDLDSLLNVSLPYCAPSSANGTFAVAPIYLTPWGAPGQMLYGTADIVNNSSDDVIVEVVKMVENYASGWESAFCLDVCMPSYIDSTTTLIFPGDTVHFSLDFFTSLTPDSSAVRLGFRNVNNENNSAAFWVRGFTSPTGIEEMNLLPAFSVFPNPANSIIQITSCSNDPGLSYNILDASGRIIISTSATNYCTLIDISGLSPGLYYIEQSSLSGREVLPFIRQ